MEPNTRNAAAAPACAAEPSWPRRRCAGSSPASSNRRRRTTPVPIAPKPAAAAPSCLPERAQPLLERLVAAAVPQADAGRAAGAGPGLARRPLGARRAHRSTPGQRRGAGGDAGQADRAHRPRRRARRPPLDQRAQEGQPAAGARGQPHRPAAAAAAAVAARRQLGRRQRRQRRAARWTGPRALVRRGPRLQRADWLITGRMPGAAPCRRTPSAQRWARAVASLGAQRAARAAAATRRATCRTPWLR